MFFFSFSSVDILKTVQVVGNGVERNDRVKTQPQRTERMGGGGGTTIGNETQQIQQNKEEVIIREVLPVVRNSTNYL